MVCCKLLISANWSNVPTTLGASPARPGIAAERAAMAAAAVVGGVPSTDVPIPDVILSSEGGVGRSGAVCVRGCCAAMLATAIAGAASDRATVSSGISADMINK